MKIGKLDGWNALEFMKNVEKTYTFHKRGRKETMMINNEDLKNLLSKNKISISTNGVLYRNDKKGLIPVM